MTGRTVRLKKFTNAKHRSRKIVERLLNLNKFACKIFKIQKSRNFIIIEKMTVKTISLKKIHKLKL